MIVLVSRKEVDSAMRTASALDKSISICSLDFQMIGNPELLMEK